MRFISDKFVKVVARENNELRRGRGEGKDLQAKGGYVNWVFRQEELLKEQIDVKELSFFEKRKYKG